ncbi:MAG: helix-turn-helix transcriptional regulator [Paludibacteraceae bacterium]|nr:helix-turn-helix transcriptional regulator [Paludibacteraceae bacterium]
MTASEILARNLKAYRNKMGLSQRKFAEKADLDTKEIYYIENQLRHAKLDTLDKLSLAIGVSVAELLEE